MAVTGAIKFFERSKLLASDGATARFGTLDLADNLRFIEIENSSISNLLSFDRDNYFRYVQQDESVGFTAYEIRISFPRAVNIDRLFVLDTNLSASSGFLFFKDGVPVSLKPNPIDHATFYDIDNVARAGSPSIATANLSSFYFELANSIEIDSFSFQFYLGGTNNGGIFNPYIRQIIATNEIGTLIGFPNISGYNENNNEIINKTSTGLKHVTKQQNTIDSFAIKFRSHPIENDVKILDQLYNSRESFTLWPCGGGYGRNHFMFEKDGWKLDDVFNVQTVGNKSNRWHKNFYKGGISSTVQMVESL